MYTLGIYENNFGLKKQRENKHYVYRGGHMLKFIKISAMVLMAGLMGCTKTVESQMQDYLEFYYPTSGIYYYQINFEWGDYIIDTGASADEELHPDSELYRGYITARTSTAVTPEGEKLHTYLVTPKGEVWITDASDIPETKTRQEVVIEKTDSGTSTSTSTINSTSEPVIDHFLNHKDAWKKYGTLKSADGKNYSFEPETKE